MRFAAGAAFRFVLNNDASHEVGPSPTTPHRRCTLRECVLDSSGCDRGVQLLAPILLRLLEKFFSLMGEMGMDDVSGPPPPPVVSAVFLSRTRCGSRWAVCRSCPHWTS